VLHFRRRFGSLFAVSVGAEPTRYLEYLETGKLWKSGKLENQSCSFALLESLRRARLGLGEFLAMGKTDRKKVMFVCLGNACRSPMAEAIARRNAADVMEATSAGLTPLGCLEPMTIHTLSNNGYVSDELESKPILRAALDAADLVVNMSGRPREVAFDNPAKVEDWYVEDPYGADAELYQRIFEKIERRVAELADRLRNGKGTETVQRNTKRKGSVKRI
jgi:arsenate reductase